MARTPTAIDQIDVRILMEKAKRIPTPNRDIGRIVSRSHVVVGQRLAKLENMDLITTDPSTRAKYTSDDGLAYLEDLKTDENSDPVEEFIKRNE